MRGLEAVEGYDSMLARQMQAMEEELNEKGAKDLEMAEELEADQGQGQFSRAPSIERKSPRKTKRCQYQKAPHSFE